MKSKILSLKEYREHYLLNLTGSDTTRYQYKKVFDLALDCFGGALCLYELNIDHVQQFKVHLEIKYNSEHTVNRYLSYFKTIYLRYWETHKSQIYDIDPKFVLIKGNPFKGQIRHKIRTRNKSESFISDEIFNKILSAAKRFHRGDPDELFDLITVYRYLGLRRNEALLIRPCDIYEDHVIITEEKDGPYATRAVPLFNEVAGILKRRKSLGNEFIFQYRSSTLYDHFKEIVAGLGYKRFTLQSLRITFGSSLILRNYPIKKVSQWLGHDTVKTTEEWYSILLESDFKYWINREKEKEIKLV